jgi:hypothetical protein
VSVVNYVQCRSRTGSFYSVDEHLTVDTPVV